MPSLPQAFLDRLDAQFGPSTAARVIAGFKAARERRSSFRANTLKSDDEAVMAVLREANIGFERVKGIPHAFFVRNLTDRELLEHPLNQQGKIYLQGIASMLPPLVLDPKPGETVLDLCAAPGSKTTQMAAMMQGRGSFMACEDDSIRFQKLQNTLRIQGASFVEARNEDAATLYHSYEGYFDKVLADVPCSAEGRIDLGDQRSHGYWSEGNITANAKIQRRLLRSAARCLKPGGTLVYSTCTLAMEENEGMVDWLLSEFSDLKTEKFDLPLQDMKRWSNHTMTVLPTKDHEGFFVAKIKKG